MVMHKWMGGLCCITCLALISCGNPPQHSKSAMENSAGIPIERANPAFLQQLERQAMLNNSAEMAKIVSGSQLAWRTSASLASPDEFLGHADTWLDVNPLTLLVESRRTAFDHLADGNISAVLREAGIKGMYVAPTGGTGTLWSGKLGKTTTGEDVAQYNFSEAAGKDAQYRRLVSNSMEQQNLLGSDLIPAATGIGPDFMLAARNMREYPGIYCMVDIPRELWSVLPAMTEETNGTPLTAEAVAALNKKGLLPKAMRDEAAPLSRKGGWAATGEIRGLDATTRRWVYRYYLTPDSAVLNWEDPSQAAHRILSGSAVRQVGMQGQALIGLRFEAFQGLEPVAKSGRSGIFSVEPALTAAQAMSREIRRYGGWSFVRDTELTLQSVNEFIRSGADFVYDSAFSPAAEHALLTGDATLAKFMADELLRLRVDTRRLVHAMPSQDGINYSLPHLSYLATTAGEQAARLRQHTIGTMTDIAGSRGATLIKDNILYSTAPGLAAMALGLDPSDVPTDKMGDVGKGHELLVLFKAMQPGLLLLAGQDLAGALPLASGSAPDAEFATRGGYSLTASASSNPVNRQGMPKTKTIYQPADVQVHSKDSFLNRIGRLVKLRRQIGLAKGTLVARPATKDKGLIALVTRLPDGKSYVLSVCNFSQHAVSESISLSGISGIASALGKMNNLGGSGSFAAAGSSVNVTLGPWQGKAVLMGNMSTAGTTDDADQTEKEDSAPKIPAVPDTLPSVQEKQNTKSADPAEKKADNRPHRAPITAVLPPVEASHAPTPISTTTSEPIVSRSEKPTATPDASVDSTNQTPKVTPAAATVTSPVPATPAPQVEKSDSPQKAPPPAAAPRKINPSDMPPDLNSLKKLEQTKQQ